MSSSSNIEYSRHDTLLLKGVAIVAIVFHNYFHWLYSTTKENEFNFSSESFPNLINAVVARPQETIHAFFTYFGHLGVALFIFISAYGLAKSYPQVSGYSTFVVSRFRKIYPPVLIALVMWLIFFGRQQGITGPVYYLIDHIDSVMYLLLGVSNFIPGYAMEPVGPWWFIPFILQFYLLYPVLIKLASEFSRSMLVIGILGLILTIFVNPVLVQHYQINLLFTPFGHLPEICLGIYAAKTKLSITLVQKLVVLAVFGLSNLYEFWWAFHNITALVLFLWAYEGIKKLCDKYYIVDRSLAVFGQFSLGLFLINGFLRGPFVGTATGYHSLMMENLFSLANFITCLFFAVLLHKVDTCCRLLVSKV